jgi:hypothetical protein
MFYIESGPYISFSFTQKYRNTSVSRLLYRLIKSSSKLFAELIDAHLTLYMLSPPPIYHTA